MPKVTPLDDISASYRSAREAVDYAIKVMDSALNRINYTVKRGSARHLEMRRDLPYFIHDMDFPDAQILVNRNYKPLGNNSETGENWIKYEDCTNVHVRLSQAEIASIVSPHHKRGMYGDGDQPWRSRRDAITYALRLEKLRDLLK